MVLLFVAGGVVAMEGTSLYTGYAKVSDKCRNFAHENRKYALYGYTEGCIV